MPRSASSRPTSYERRVNSGSAPAVDPQKTATRRISLLVTSNHATSTTERIRTPVSITIDSIRVRRLLDAAWRRVDRWVLHVERGQNRPVVAVRGPGRVRICRAPDEPISQCGGAQKEVELVWPTLRA